MNFVEQSKKWKTDLICKWNSTLASIFADSYALMESGQNFDFEFDFKYASILICEVHSSRDSARGISYRDNYVLQNFQGLWDGISGQLVCVHVQNQSIWVEAKFSYVPM